MFDNPDQETGAQRLARFRATVVSALDDEKVSEDGQQILQDTLAILDFPSPPAQQHPSQKVHEPE